MVSGVLSIFGWLNPKRLMIIGASLVLGWVAIQAVQFVNRAIEDREQVILLEVKNQALAENLRTKQLLLEAQSRITELAEEALQREKEISQDFLDAIGNTIDVPPEFDGPVAPVLEDTLEFLRQRRGMP